MKITKNQLRKIIKEEIKKVQTEIKLSDQLGTKPNNLTKQPGEIESRPPSVSDMGPGFDEKAEPPLPPDIHPNEMHRILQQYMAFMDYFDRPDNKEVISQAAEIIAGFGDF